MNSPTPEPGERPVLSTHIALLLGLVNLSAVALIAWVGLTLPGLAVLVTALAADFLLLRLVRDTSDLHAHLQALLDASFDAALTCDEQGRICSANPAAGRMFGYATGELSGMPLSLLLAGPLQGGTVVAEARRKDDSRFLVSLSLRTFRQCRQVLSIVCVHDLSALETARRASESASRARTAFLVNMSHEFRTPLNGILGLAELLRECSLPEEHIHHLNLLMASAETLMALVEQVLDFSRLESGEVTLDRRFFSLRQLLAEVLAPFDPLARGKGLELSHHVTADVSDSWLGDAVRLRQTLRHLVGNAIKFTPQGEVLVEVKKGTTEDTEDTEKRQQAGASECSSSSVSSVVPLLFSVRDTGIGIPPERQGSIFAPFEQADLSSTRGHGGVGLGLSIATRLVGLMGGQICVDSAPGRGSTFHVRLALEPAQPGQPERSYLPSVLLALSDDERRFHLEQQVRALGWPVVAVASGQAALGEYLQAAVQGSPFGLLLLQESLPDLDTAGWLAQLEGYPVRCPAILLADGGQTRRNLPRNVACVLPLSPDPQALRHALRECSSGTEALAAAE
jgi:signal transduction histidine kinase/CheY-like chemotaxis protein